MDSTFNKRKPVERTPEEKQRDEFAEIFQTLSYEEKAGLRIFMRMPAEARTLIFEFLEKTFDLEKRNFKARSREFNASEFIVALMKSETPDLRTQPVQNYSVPDYEDEDTEEELRNMRSFRNLLRKFNDEHVHDE